MLILKFTGEGKIFYVQKRIGRHQNIFNVLKFATMLENSPNIGSGTITLKNDPRVLPFGKFLRATKINELPQLFNIFIGDMSFVGPRPLTHEVWDNYDHYQKEVISTVRPGLTGLGSIYFRNEEKYFTMNKDPKEIYKDCIAPKKASCEIWFVKNNNLVVYFVLIVVTFIAVIFKNSEFIIRLIDTHILNLKKS